MGAVASCSGCRGWIDADDQGLEPQQEGRCPHRLRRDFSEPDEQSERQQISIYYFVLDQYQPAVGPPSQQTDDGLIGKDELRQLADENRALW